MSPERLRVLRAWWRRLVDEGGGQEIRTLFADPPKSFASFCARLDGKPVYAHYAEDDDGQIVLGPVLWGIPLARSITLGLWIPRPLRRRKQTLARIEDLIGLAFKEWPVLLAGAETKARARLYERYGFSGMWFPHLGEDGDVWLGWLTPESWRRRVGD